MVSLSAEARIDLRWRNYHLRESNGKSFFPDHRICKSLLMHPRTDGGQCAIMSASNVNGRSWMWHAT